MNIASSTAMATQLHPDTQHVCYDTFLERLVNISQQAQKKNDFFALCSLLTNNSKLNDDFLNHDEVTCDRVSPTIKSAIQCLIKRNRTLWQDGIYQTLALERTKASLGRQEALESAPNLKLVRHCCIKINGSIYDFTKLLMKNLECFKDRRIIYYSNDDGAECMSGFLSRVGIPEAKITMDSTYTERQLELEFFRIFPSVLNVSGKNVSVEELKNIPVDAVFHFYPARSKDTRRVEGGIVNYEEQISALCRFGSPGLSLVFIQDKEVRGAVTALSEIQYNNYGTRFKELDTRIQGGSFAETLRKYLS
ncbi:hypothetical protein K492DRAFT_207283 [Lichtheimia hyalospora FSU 10163]|nr:hypothetical protein K492DRAFT_207283 [Lichtheimia hyalospora FSU 10163]